MSFLIRSLLILGLLAVNGTASYAKVVINEIMYHPPDDRDELQWLELHNTGEQAVNLAGWSLVKGVQFTFTNSVSLPPGGFIVIARDRGAFVTHYRPNTPVVGDFKGRLSHGGERIELANPAKTIVDAVEFSDALPWPTSPTACHRRWSVACPISPPTLTPIGPLPRCHRPRAPQELPDNPTPTSPPIFHPFSPTSVIPRREHRRLQPIRNRSKFSQTFRIPTGSIG